MNGMHLFLGLSVIAAIILIVSSLINDFRIRDLDNEPETELEDCPDCDGLGYVDELGETDCPHCEGTGLIEVITIERTGR